MRFTRPSILAAAGVLSAAIIGGLAGCEQRTADVPAARNAPGAKDSRSFMAGVVQPATQVL